MEFVPNLTANSVPEIVANNLELKPVIQCIGASRALQVSPNPMDRESSKFY